MAEELYIKLFVRTGLNHAALLTFVASVVGGIVDMWTVVCEPYELDVRPNDDFDEGRLNKDPNDFICFPYTIEIAAPDGHPLEDYLLVASRVMAAVADNGAGVVAACDWEDRLPGGGRLGL